MPVMTRPNVDFFCSQNIKFSPWIYVALIYFTHTKHNNYSLRPEKIAGDFILSIEFVQVTYLLFSNRRE
jgi:hypothetical protein